jgi:peptide deformylase
VIDLSTQTLYTTISAGTGNNIDIIYNPVLVSADVEQELGQEGCLSFPGLLLQVSRPKIIMVRYQNNKGEFLLSRLEGLEARCFQHELDHLDGITFNKKENR